MKPATIFQPTKYRTLIGAAAALFAGAAADAQTNVYTTDLPHADDVGFDDPLPNDWDGVDFQVPVANGNGNNIWGYYGIFDPPYKTNWQTPEGKRYQYTKFSAPVGPRRAVLMGLFNGNQDGVVPDAPIDLTVKSLTLENVDVDPGAVQLSLGCDPNSGDCTGAALSWAMSNARYATAAKTPAFQSGLPLEMSSVAGTSEIVFWNGEIASPTKLVVNPGSTFVFERVGDIGMLGDPTKQLVFSQQDANKADVNGGTLRLDFSGVVFDTAPEAAVSGGEVTAGLVVRNGGTLRLSGSDDDVAATRLEMRGGMLVDSGTVSLGERTTIELNAVGEDETLVLNNATVNLEPDAALKADLTTFGGTNTVTTAAPQLALGTEGFRSPVAFQDAATVLNVEGTGDFIAKDLLSLNGGTLNLNMTPATGRLISTGPFTGAGTVDVASGNVLEIRSDFDQRTFGTTIVNEGTILVGDGGKLAGAGTIAETGGLISVLAGGKLDGNTLPQGEAGVTMGALTLEFGSELKVGIDPSAGQAGLISVGQLILDSPVSSLAPLLTIGVTNDAGLPLGQKFLLVDYTSISSGSPQFLGFPDGHIFRLGLNTYQIFYEDPAFSPTNSSVITLTVVESPYETWINGYAGIPVDKRGPTDDADGDGCANVFEFAHNGDPTDPSDKGLLAWLIQDASAPAGEEFTLVAAMRNGAVFSAGPDGVQSASVDGITSTVEGSVDLVAFPGSPVSHVGGPSGTAPPVTGLPDLTSAAWKYHTFKLDASEGLPNRGFMRTKAAINTVP